MKKRGFTLVELIIVIIVIGILAAVSIIGYIGSQKTARDSQRKSDLSEVQEALAMYYTDKKTYPGANDRTFFTAWDARHNSDCWCDSVSDLPTASPAKYDLRNALVPGYIDKLPEDPINKEGGSGNLLGDGPTVDNAYVYGAANDGKSYVLGTNFENEAGNVTQDNIGNYHLTN